MRRVPNIGLHHYMAVLAWGGLTMAPSSAWSNEEASQWGLQLIGAYEAHALGYTGAGQTFGVLDSGVSSSHLELQGQVVGTFMSSRGEVPVADMIDYDGHGTHVTGIIAARKNDIGMHGIAYDAKAIVADGIGYTSPIDSLNYLASREDVRFINHSWGYGLSIVEAEYLLSTELPDYLVDAFLEIDEVAQALLTSSKRGQVHIFATGNEEFADASILAGLPYLAPELQPNWIAVTAIGQAEGLEDTPLWANYCGVARDWCLAAPGDPILSLDKNDDQGYVEMGGTSMATPYVTGAALLVQQAFPWMTGPQVAQTILTTAKDLGAPGVDDAFGWGLLDVQHAVGGPAQLVSDWTVDLQGHTATWRNDISGQGGLIKTGEGTLILDGNNSYTGRTTIYGGALEINAASGLGRPKSPVWLDGGALRLVENSFTLKHPFVLGKDDGAFITTSSQGMSNNIKLTGAITGAGTLYKYGNGTLTLAGNSSHAGGTVVQDGTLAINGRLASRVVVASGATLRGTGTINDAAVVMGTLYPGNPAGTLTINGSLYQAPGSRLHLDIDGRGKDGNSPRLQIRGAGNAYTADGIIVPVLHATSAITGSHAPAVGTKFNIVTAEGGVLGSFDGITQPDATTLPASRFDTVYGPRAISLYVTPASYSDLSAFNAHLSGTQAAVGALLDARRPLAGVRGAGATDNQALFDSLAPLSIPEIPRAYDQMAGVTIADSLYAALDNARLLNRRLADALHTARQPQDNGRHIYTARLGNDSMQTTVAPRLDLPVNLAGATSSPTGWVQGFGGRGKHHSGSDSYGHAFDLSGGLMGLEQRSSPEHATGIALGYANRQMDFRQGMGNARVENWQLDAYASQPLDDWHMDAQIGIGTAHITGKRSLSFANASSNMESRATIISAAVDASKRLTQAIEATVGADYAYMRHDGFDEDKGMAATHLTVDPGSLQSAGMNAGLRASAPLRFGNNHWSLSGHARIRQELADKQGYMDASFMGGSLEVEGSANARTSMAFGTRLAGQQEQWINPFLDIEHERSSHARTTLVSAGIDVRW